MRDHPEPGRLTEVADCLDDAAVIGRYRAAGQYVCHGCLASGAGRAEAAGLVTTHYGGVEVLEDFGAPTVRVCLPACRACLDRLAAGDAALADLFDWCAALVAARARREWATTDH